MGYDKRKMQDISIIEKQVWTEYMHYLKIGDYSNAIAILNDNPNLKYKVFNSFNWNRLQNLVNDGTEWSVDADSRISTDSSTDCLVGQFACDYNELLSKGKHSRYVGYWSEGNNYEPNNLVKVDEHFSYFCLASHTSSQSNKPPNSDFWILAVNVLSDDVGIPVSKDRPGTNILYFKIIE